jgi:hypothetical protein
MKKKKWANSQRIIELFTQKIDVRLSKYRFGIRKKPIPDPGSGVEKASDPGSRSATLMPSMFICENSVSLTLSLKPFGLA